jgi:hypothetical protein
LIDLFCLNNQGNYEGFLPSNDVTCRYIVRYIEILQVNEVVVVAILLYSLDCLIINKLCYQTYFRDSEPYVHTLQGHDAFDKASTR